MEFVSAFLSHFSLKKPPGWDHKAAMMVRGNLLKRNFEERGEFSLIKPLNYHAAKQGGPIVKLFLCRSVDGFSHLLRHFRQVLIAKKCSGHRNLSVGVSGTTLEKFLN